MEPFLFRGRETGFRFSEKVFIILHGLPVFNHRVHFLVVMWCVAQTLLAIRGAIGDWRMWSLNASARFNLYVNS